MLEEIIKDLENKRIVILGFGREGKSTYEFLRKHFAEKVIDVIDENIELESESNAIYMEDMYLNIIKTSEYFEMLDTYDLIFKTPGISFKGKDVSKIESKITSQLEIVLKYFKSKTTIIGITGTKGKSTTSSLVYQILVDQGKRAHLLGNIGKPIFTELEDIKEGDILVLEISSHQSQYIKYSPNIGVVLNIFKEHLDHYNSYEEYIMAKLNVLKYGEKSDFAIYDKNNVTLVNSLEKINVNSAKIPVDIDLESRYEYFDFKKERNILGRHNNFNIMVALEIVNILGLDKDKACNTIYSFKSLPHRLENIGTYDEVTYYNDSICTIPEAAISCIETLKRVNTILIGGMDRGIDYEFFAKYLNSSDVENIVCMYETGKKIKEMLDKLNTSKNVMYFDDLKSATEYAKKVTKKGMICALSPAAASYGYFKNFEERGDAFKEYVRE